MIVGRAGRLYISSGIRLLDSGEIPTHLLPGIKKGLAKVYLQLLQPKKEIDWVFFRPDANLQPSQRTGIFRLGKDNLIIDENGENRISVEDYTVAMMNELEHPKHHREAFTIGY